MNREEQGRKHSLQQENVQRDTAECGSHCYIDI